MVQAVKYDEAKAIDARVRALFTYEVKEFNLLHWRSHGDAVRAGEPWRGPCGDMTSTVLDLATKEGGAALADCFRIIVGANGGKTADHIVACIKTSDRGYIVIGDTGGPPYPSSRFPHRPLEYNCLAEAGPGPEDTIWREGTPWEADEVARLAQAVGTNSGTNSGVSGGLEGHRTQAGNGFIPPGAPADPGGAVSSPVAPATKPLV